jgi:CDP-diacylglycerol--glycerol-3-phosphate 3-phosphatidyltransferase
VSAADWLSASRLFLVVLLWPAAMAGEGRLVGVGLVVAAATDVLDGYLARRLSVASVRGARLDAIADTSLMVSAGAWLQLLHPRLVTDNLALLGAAGGLYVAAVVATSLAFRRLVNPRQLSAKAAGGLLYGFALITFLTSVYEPLLLTVALLALGIASVEALVAAIITIHATGIASRVRSQSPQPTNEVGSSSRATKSITTSAAPIAEQIGP